MYNIKFFKKEYISLEEQIEKTEANRSLWVYSATVVGSMFFDSGLLLISIRGRHAKLKTSEIYTVQYIPQK